MTQYAFGSLAAVSREDRNNFLDETAGMKKEEREADTHYS